MGVASWADFKTLTTNKKLLMQYSESPTTYDVFLSEAGAFLWNFTIQKGSEDATDFETNFKATANQPVDVRASANRPPRISASPQPANTTEKWKGFEIACGAEDSSKYVDVTFASLVYLKGGTIYSDDVADGDKFKAEVQVIANGATVMSPMEDIFLIPSVKIDVTSPECMEFSTALRLRITFTPASTGTAKKVYFVVNYYA